MKKFWKDDSARVPFAVIGIFLILISTMVSLNLNRLDIKMAKTMSSGIEITAADAALQYAKADIARAINYAGMDALKKIGQTPVVRPDGESEYYNGTNGNPEEFNRNWAKAMINSTLNRYIESNYMNDTFVNYDFSVNLDSPGSWEDIEIEPVNMSLAGRSKPPVLAPGTGEYQSYGTYWKVSVPLRMHMKDLRAKSELMNENITVETIITSRYPLLRDLTDEYSERLNGTNAVMAETTALAMAYTWARGYLQYAEGTPLNIVDNEHLALIMNGALLLDQGFVFNSVDPMSIVEYANQTASALSGNSNEYQDISLENGSLSIDPLQDAFDSTGDPQRAEQEFNKAKKFDYNATLATDFINNKTSDNSIAAQKIAEVSRKVYSATIKTIVLRNSVITSRGTHAGHPIDLGIVGWNNISEPVKDWTLSSNITRETNLSPGVLYGEVWNMDWVLNHKWRKTWTETVPCGESSCTVTRHHDIIVNDSQTDNVTFKIYAAQDSYYEQVLNYTKTRQRRYNDLNNAFMRHDVNYSSVHEDMNLEDVPESYISNYFTADIRRNDILRFGFTAPDGVREVSVAGFYDAWLEEEAQAAVDEIRDKINEEIHLDPDINYFTYPIPSDLLNASENDLISKIERNESGYVDNASYMNQSRYGSASAKVISLVREWYVDEVKYQIQEKFREGRDQIDDEIERNFTGSIKDANRNATGLLSEGMNLPLGLAMKAYHVDENGTAYAGDELEAWNESVTLAIDQEPDYLFMDAGGSDVELITLGVRNVNIFGSTGLPVLPSMDPWLGQFNAWKIEVQGKFNKFEVQDIDNEVHPNPIFGHEAQVYVREDDRGVVDILTDLPIGDNLPIKFSFTTGTFILVPPGKTIGDKEGGASEESPYFGRIL